MWLSTVTKPSSFISSSPSTTPALSLSSVSWIFCSFSVGELFSIGTQGQWVHITGTKTFMQILSQFAPQQELCCTTESEMNFERKKEKVYRFGVVKCENRFFGLNLSLHGSVHFSHVTFHLAIHINVVWLVWSHRKIVSSLKVIMIWTADNKWSDTIDTE